MDDSGRDAWLRNLGKNEAEWKHDRVTVCKYVIEGERLAAIRSDGDKPRGGWAVVTMAAGYHARVRFERDGHECMVNVQDCARPKQSSEVSR